MSAETQLREVNTLRQNMIGYRDWLGYPSLGAALRAAADWLEKECHDDEVTILALAHGCRPYVAAYEGEEGHWVGLTIQGFPET
jgi:hypothetical protein